MKTIFKNIKPLTCILLMVTGFVNLQCKSKDEAAPAQADNFPFIKYDNTTGYDLTEVRPDGTDTTTQFGFSSNIGNYLGDNLYQVIQLHHHFNDTVYWYKSNSEWAVVAKGGVRIDYLRPNAKTGDTYFALIARGGSKPDTLFTRIESLSENITVPAGTYNCIKTRQFYPASTGFSGSYQVDYINKTVGIIKTEFYSDNKLSSKYELRAKNY